jgi:nucleoside phosphorylase
MTPIHSPKFNKIAILFAMEAEAMPVIQKLGLKPDPSFGDPELPFRYFKGGRGRVEILLALAGKDSRFGVDLIGTEPATLNAYLVFRGFKPDLCINAGTAGGFIKRGGRIGDVYLSTEPFRYHDRRIPIPGFEEYGIGSYPVLGGRTDLDLPALARQLGLKEGAVTTGSSLDYTEHCLRLMDRHEGVAKEMEACAIAWVAWLLKVPMIALKSVTDLVDGPHPTQDEFLANLSFASSELEKKLLMLLDFLDSSRFPG